MISPPDRSVPDLPVSWPRPHYTRPGGNPFLFYVVFGRLAQPIEISRTRYRMSNVPAGLDIVEYRLEQQREYIESFRSGYLWDEFKRTDPALAARAGAEESCVVLRGAFADSPTLDYFRDTIGLITWILDRGGIAVYDPLMFRWWSPTTWQERVFAPATAMPHRHTVILTSPEPAGTEWIHTRGMRKFGRPDISFQGVPAELKAGAVELCERFIEFQALGGVIEDGMEIKMHTLPPGLRCHHRGSLDDPDFNNVHVAIER